MKIILSKLPCKYQKNSVRNNFILARPYAARKTIFSFSRRPEKMIFPKKSRWNLTFLLLRGNMTFFFPRKYDLSARRKMKDDLSQKNTRKYDIFFKCSQKMVFSKRTTPGHDLSCIVSKDSIFSPKACYFFLGQKIRDDLSQETHDGMIFSVYMDRCYGQGALTLCQKKSKTILSCKNTLKDG